MRERHVLAILFALVAAAGVGLLWAFVQLTPEGGRPDTRLLEAAVSLRTPNEPTPFRTIASLADPAPFALMAAVVVLVAIVRRRVALAIGAGVLLVGANVTTQVLKPALASPQVERVVNASVSDAAFPSGHSTAAMSVALAALLVVPPAWRAVTALAGASFAIAVGAAVCVMGWHYPSDVLGGWLVAAAWAAAVYAALGAWAGLSRRSGRAPRGARAPRYSRATG